MLDNQIPNDGEQPNICADDVDDRPDDDALERNLLEHRIFLQEQAVTIVKTDGAQGRDRTTDTAIFSRMLYQLSYLGTAGGPEAGGSGGL